jgi:GTPase-associated protein 1, N-terminal domain type 2
MMYELQYTSAPKTLDGAGYGVVSKTRGFPPALEEFVRKLSFYDFLTPSKADAESLDPAVFSHAIWEQKGSRWHIFSRVGPGGVDYSHRTVFFAHHVAVSGDMFCEGSAARLMQDPSLFETSWDGTVGEVEARPFPKCPSPITSASTWARVTGDPRWARVWAEKCQADATQSGFLIAPPNVEILDLFAEASRWISDDRVRDIAFVTLLVRDQPASPINWAGLPPGRPLTENMLSKVPDRVTDLTKSLPPLPAPHSKVERSRRPVAIEQGEGIKVEQREGIQLDYEDFRGESEKASRSPRPYKLQSDPDRSHSKPAQVQPPPPPPPPPQNRWLTPGRVAAVVLICGGLTGAGLLSLHRSHRRQSDSKPVTDPPKRNETGAPLGDSAKSSVTKSEPPLHPQANKPTPAQTVAQSDTNQPRPAQSITLVCRVMPTIAGMKHHEILLPIKNLDADLVLHLKATANDPNPALTNDPFPAILGKTGALTLQWTPDGLRIDWEPNEGQPPPNDADLEEDQTACLDKLLLPNNVLDVKATLNQPNADFTIKVMFEKASGRALNHVSDYDLLMECFNRRLPILPQIYHGH